jgi:hypothetical protein
VNFVKKSANLWAVKQQIQRRLAEKMGNYYIKPKTNGIKISARFAEKPSIKSSNLIFYNPKL